MKRFLLPFAASLTLLLIGPVSAQTSEQRADRLLIERSQQAAILSVPANGMTMAQVESRFGAPRERRAPVGGNKPEHPPITRWVYEGFSVYFEHDRVISAVLNRASQRERGPVPVN